MCRLNPDGSLAEDFANRNLFCGMLGWGSFRALSLWCTAVPNLAPVLLAQFWIAVPVFILAEANSARRVWA